MRPARHPSRTLIALALAAAACAAAPAPPAIAVSLQSSLWVLESYPSDVARVGDRVFVCGGVEFYTGPYTGHAALLRASDAGRVAGFPEVFNVSQGNVRCAVPDGAGGWFVGGDFDRAGAFARANLAHIAADHTVTAWNPGTNGVVTALALDGGTLYLAGTFTTVGGQTRNRAAAVSATTGAVTAWNPNVSGAVWALAVGPADVWLGGLFTAVGGQARPYLAAVDRATGALRTGFAPAPDNGVNALERAGNTLYAGGDFLTIGGQSRSRLAALDASTGQATAWDPVAAGSVQDLELEGGTLYAAGGFGQLGGQTRNKLGAVDTLTGLATAFDARILAGGDMRALSVDGGVVYAGGGIRSVGTSSPGTRRRAAAAFDAATGALLPWYPAASTDPQVMVAQGSEVFVGGAFGSITGVEHGSLVGFDAVAGGAPLFAPTFPLGSASVLAGAGNTLFVGGGILGSGSAPPRYLMAYDATTFAPTWYPVLDGEVLALLVQGDTLYVAGGFTHAEGQARSGLAAYDWTSGALLPWNPGNCLGVRTMAVNGPELVVGGTFSTLAGQARTRIGALDRGTGAVTAWAPVVNGSRVYDLAVTGGRIHAVGDFTSFGGQARARLASVDAVTHAVTSWNPGANAVVRTIEADGASVFVGGDFTSIGSPVSIRTGLVALDVVTGAATAWDPKADDPLYGLHLAAGVLYAWGPVTSFDGVGRWYLGALAHPALAAIEEPGPRSAGLRLAAPVPNPAGSHCTLQFELPRATATRLELYDVSGRRVRATVDAAPRAAGRHRVRLDLSGLAAGHYVARLRAGDEVASTRVVVTH